MVILHSAFGFVQYYHHSRYYNPSYCTLPRAIIPYYEHICVIELNNYKSKIQIINLYWKC